MGSSVPMERNSAIPLNSLTSQSSKMKRYEGYERDLNKMIKSAKQTKSNNQNNLSSSNKALQPVRANSRTPGTSPAVSAASQSKRYQRDSIESIKQHGKNILDRKSAAASELTVENIDHILSSPRNIEEELTEYLNFGS